MGCTLTHLIFIWNVRFYYYYYYYHHRQIVTNIFYTFTDISGTPVHIHTAVILLLFEDIWQTDR